MYLFEMINNNIKRIAALQNGISEARKSLLESFGNYISDKLSKKETVNLNFICTHNSRRSHISQIWAQTAAAYYDIPGIKCFSGGTEATAFNPRAVKAMTELGFKIEKEEDSANPVYRVYYSESAEPILCFSKKYDDPFNPHSDFAAIMTCSDADDNCPYIPGAAARFPVRYEDPKKYDDTEQENSKYRERCEQIGAEMLYAFSLIKKY
ncbi:MAG: protein-tyrosine-phosphatase [Ignavibacteriaceae bacterium]|nr:protein-tyrosine-phosphatase [Ignavibacteriaceae bacterium]